LSQFYGYSLSMSDSTSLQFQENWNRVTFYSAISYPYSSFFL
jgi:hypothetical protein